MRLILFMTILFLINQLVFAVPEGGNLRLVDEGVFCLKSGDKKIVKVLWDTGILDTNDHCWTAFDGSIDFSKPVNYLGTFNPSTGSYEIEFYETGIYNISVTIKWQYKDIPPKVVSKTFRVILVDLKEVILDVGPDYAPVGKNVADTTFEIEKRTEDKLKFRAVTEPTSEEIAPMINWGTESGISTGYTKEVNYDSNGTKFISVYIGSCTFNIKVYVNENASTKMTKPLITVNGGEWAHKGEFVDLTVDCEDLDWKEGVKLDENFADLANAQWHFNSVVGSITNDGKGKNVKWSPKNNWIGTTPIYTTVKDKLDPYSPRQEGEIDSAEQKVGAFIVKVQLTMTSGVGAANSVTTLDELGNPMSPAELTETGSASAIAKESQITSSDNILSNYGEARFGIQWEFMTEPPEAQPKGNIKATLGTSGSAKMAGSVLDNDYLDDDYIISVGIPIPILNNIGVTVEIPITVASSDGDEGTATMACALISEGADFDQSLPDADENNLKLQSMSMIDRELGPNSVPLHQEKEWSVNKEKIITNSKGSKINIGYGFKAFARASANWKAALDTVDTFGEAEISNIKVKSKIIKVEYVPN